MIDFKELRVGNWVQKSGGNQPYMITVERFWEHYNTADAFYYLDPIPITPETLEKCGFNRRSKNGRYYFNNDDSVRINHFQDLNVFHLDLGYTIPETGEDWIMINDIHSLHQLQNLYFALTQTELNYQP